MSINNVFLSIKINFDYPIIYNLKRIKIYLKCRIMKLQLLKKNFNLLFSVLFFAFGIAMINAQTAASYSFTSTTATYANLTGTTNVVGLGNTSDDVLSNTTNIGFTFNFAGTNYTQFKVSSNGFVTFNTGSTDSFFDNTQANAGTNKPVLMPLWDDLQSTARARFRLDGSSPNRIMKIEWRGNEWNYQSGADAIKFQVWLYETSNRIEFHYQQSADPANNPSATIGIYDASDTYLTLDGSGASPSASSTTFTTTIGAKPASNQVYRFDPPSDPVIATSASSLPQFTACNLAVSASQTFQVSGILLTADILITAPAGFEVSTDNVNFFDTRTLVRSGGNVALTTIYARMKALASNPTAANITATSTGATTRNISLSGILVSPTGVSAGTDVSVCASSSLVLDGSVDYDAALQTLSTIDGDAGFATLTTNDTNRWSISATTNAGGSANELRMQWSTGSNPTPVSIWVQSPLLDASELTNLSMDFKHNLDWFAGTAPLAMQTSPDGITWTTRWSQNATANVAATTVTVDLSAVNESSFFYRFLYDGNIFNIDFWYIDDIVITGNFVEPTYSWTSSPSGFTSSLQDPTVSPTLTTTYTLAVTSNGCTVTDEVVVTVDSTTWTSASGGSWTNGAPTATTAAVIEFDYTSVGNVDACSLTVTNNAVVIITSGDSVNLNGSLTVDSGSSFTLENNANLLQGGTTNSNSGDITVKRNSSALLRQDFTLWSAPVAGQNLLDFSPSTLATRFYTYSTIANQYTAVVPSTTDFATATGYLIRMPNNHPSTATVWEGAFAGVPNNGDYSFTMTDNGSGQRFNAVGNPYPSPIDATAFVGNATNAANTTGTLYFWRKTNNAASPSYCSWTTGGFVTNSEAQVVDPNDILQTGQGFFVEASGSGTSLVFDNTMRTDDHANQFFRTSNTIEHNRIWLNATNGEGLFSQTLVGYMTYATNAVDYGIDGKYINDGPIALTSFINEEQFVIQGRSLPFDVTDVVPLQFKANAAGNYTIAIDHVDGLFLGEQAIYLRDLLMGVDHDLKENGYSFTSEAGTFSNRFEIVYQSTLSVTNPNFENGAVVFSKDKAIEINSGLSTIASIRVVDVRGSIVAHLKDVNANSVSIPLTQIGHQVLIVQITDTDGRSISKKVVH